MSDIISSPANMTAASPQERAAMLINKVDVVISSNQARRDMLSSIENQFTNTSSFDVSETSLDTSEKEKGDTFDGHASLPVIKTPIAKLTVDRLPRTVDRLLDAESSSSRRSVSSASSSKKSRFLTVSELKAQLQDCHNALLTMRENANLKYRKLELEYVNLTSSLALVQSELDQERAKSAQLVQDKLRVQRQLEEAIGTDQATWIAKLEESQFQVGQKLALEKLERAELSEYNSQLLQVMGECGRCQRRIPQRGAAQHHCSNGGATPHTTPVRTPKPMVVSSLWGSLMSAVKEMDPSLGHEETDVSVVGKHHVNHHATFNSSSSNLNVSPKAEPPPEMFLFPQQSTPVNDDLEADISAMEKEMMSDNNMVHHMKHTSSSGSKHKSSSSKKSSSSNNKKRSSSKKKSDNNAFGSLDDFFGAATAGLIDEKMDEEKSFFSLQRSVGGKRKKKKKRSSNNKKLYDSDDEEVKKEMAQEEMESSEADDRRVSMKAAMQSKKSLRDRLMGFATEAVAEEESFAFKSSRSLRTTTTTTASLTSEIAGTSSVAGKSVRWEEADVLDRTEEDANEDEEDPILAMEVRTWGEEAHAAVVTI